MSRSTPFVSVIIPAYNHAGLICQTLESVFRQTYTDYEVVVVNDGSPDNTREILQPFVSAGRIIYIEQKNRGQAAARNKGIEISSGEFIALLDDDDCWPADKLAWQVAEMKQDPGLCMVSGCLIASWPESGQGVDSERCASCEVDFESLLAGSPITSPGQTLIRRAALVSIGGFRESVWGADDWDLYLRLSRVGRVRTVSRPALYYRVHSGNASRNMGRLIQNTLSVLDEYLPLLAKSNVREVRERARRWIYCFGVRSLILELRTCWQNRQMGKLAKVIREVWARLKVLGFDSIAIRCLIVDLTSPGLRRIQRGHQW